MYNKYNRIKKLAGIVLLSGGVLFSGCGSKETQQTDAMVTTQTEVTGTMEETGSDVKETVENSAEEDRNTAAETTEAATAKTDETTEAKESAEVGSAGIITVGTTGAPYTELLTQAKLLLAKEGWDVQIQIYTDYNKMNEDVRNGTLDAHLYAHQAYLDSYNDVNASELTSVANICYEKYGIYSILNADLTNINSGAVVALPEDDTRKARALLYLEDLGYIRLKEGVGIFAILDDIVENPEKIEFTEYSQDTLKEVLQTADYCVIGADQAILAGLEPEKEVLKEEEPWSGSAKTMATLLVTTPEKANDEKLRLLEEAIKSEETQKYMEDTYKGAWGLFP